MMVMKKKHCMVKKNRTKHYSARYAQTVILMNDDSSQDHSMNYSKHMKHISIPILNNSCLIFKYFWYGLIVLETLTYQTSSYPPCRQWALCAFDDLIEFTGPASAVYQPHFMQIMISSLLDPAHEVRQASAYGVGVAAQFGGEPYVSHCASALSHLFTMIKSSNGDQDELAYARENAISAIGKICHYASGSGAFDVNAVLVEWIQTLPIVKDEEEAGHTYSYLMDLIESGHPSLSSLSTPAHLAFVLVEALAAPTLLQDQKELSARIASGVSKLVMGLDENGRNGLWSRLSQEKRARLSERGYF